MILERRQIDNVSRMYFGWLCVLILIFSIGCSKTEEAPEIYLIGVSHADLSEDWQLELENEIQIAAKGYEGVQLVTTNANGSTYKQRKDLQVLMDYGVDLLIVTPNDSVVMNREIKKVNQKIPVILMNRMLSTDAYTMFIGPDFEEIGKKMGYVVEEITRKRKMNLVELKGPLQDVSVSGMASGLHSVIENNRQVRQYGSFVGAWKKDDVGEWFERFHELRPLSEVIVSQNQDMLLGITQNVDKEKIESFYSVVAEAIPTKTNKMTTLLSSDKQHLIAWQLGGKEAIDYGVSILKDQQNNIPQKVLLSSYYLNQENIYDFCKRLEAVQEKPLDKVALIMSQDSAWSQAQEVSIRKAFEDEKIEVRVFKTTQGIFPQQARENQIRYIEQMLEEKVDAIILSPVLEEGWNEIFEKSDNKNIPIFIIDNMINTDDRLWEMYVGYDAYSQGHMMGKWIVDNLYGKEDLNLLVIGSEREFAKQYQRNKGLMDVLSGFSRIQVKSITDINQVNALKTEYAAWVILNEENTAEIFQRIKGQSLERQEHIKALFFGDEQTYEAAVENRIDTCMIYESPDLGPLLLSSMRLYQEKSIVPKMMIIGNEIYVE